MIIKSRNHFQQILQQQQTGVNANPVVVNVVQVQQQQIGVNANPVVVNEVQVQQQQIVVNANPLVVNEVQVQQQQIGVNANPVVVNEIQVQQQQIGVNPNPVVVKDLQVQHEHNVPMDIDVPNNRLETAQVAHGAQVPLTDARYITPKKRHTDFQTTPSTKRSDKWERS